MKRKLQFYALFLILIFTLIAFNGCSASANSADLPQDAYPINEPVSDAADAVYPYPPADPSDSVSNDNLVYPGPVSTPDDFVVGEAPASQIVGLEERVYINSIDVFIKESFPVQVSVQVYGDVPDGCTTIKSTAAKLVSDDTFEVHIYTERPKDVMCTQALVSFSENIPLDVYGLPAGTYTVKVYDVESSFTLDVDNK